MSLKGKARLKANKKARNQAKNRSFIYKKSILSEIVKWDDPILKETCLPVEMNDNEGREQAISIVEEMKEVLRYSDNGVGLAASQIGYNKRIIAICLDRDKMDILICINPSIIEKSEEVMSQKEGCLSFPGFFVDIVRPKKLKVNYENLSGELISREFEDFEAAVFGHEYDHTTGVCLVGEAWKKSRDEEIERRKNRLRNRNKR